VVFGKVIEGMDVVRAIERCGSDSGKPSMAIKIRKSGEVAPPAAVKRAADDSSEHPVAKKMSPGVPERPAAADSGLVLIAAPHCSHRCACHFYFVYVVAVLLTLFEAKADGDAARPVNTRCFFEISIDGKVVAPPNIQPFPQHFLMLCLVFRACGV